MLETNQEIRSGWCVVSVQGRADAETAERLESALCAAIEQNPKVIANFAGLSYISSAGLRAVLQAARAAQGRNGEFAVCSLTPSVRRVFDLSGMHHLLSIQGELPC
jgi:anti-anti-sigma factor